MVNLVFLILEFWESGCSIFLGKYRFCEAPLECRGAPRARAGGQDLATRAAAASRAAEAMAARVAAAAPSTTARIEHLFWLTLARSPSPSELEFCQQMLNDQIQLHRASKSADADALAELCQAILNLNEQLYLE